MIEWIVHYKNTHKKNLLIIIIITFLTVLYKNTFIINTIIIKFHILYFIQKHNQNKCILITIIIITFHIYIKINKRGISSFHFLSIPYFIELSHALHEFLISCFDEKSCAQIVFCFLFFFFFFFFVFGSKKKVLKGKPSIGFLIQFDMKQS